MTTKIKISAGFGLMIILLSVLGFIGYRGLETASDYFTEYDRMASLNVSLSDISTGLYNAAYEQERFIASYDVATIDAAIKQAENILKLGENAATYFKSEERIRAASKTLQDMNNYLAALKAVKTNFSAYQEEYLTKTTPALETLHKELLSSIEGAVYNNNMGAVEHINKIWEKTSILNAAMHSAGRALTIENAKRADKSMEEFKLVMDGLSRFTVREEGRRAMASLLAAYADIEKTFAVLSGYGNQSIKDIAKSYELRDAIMGFVHDTNKEVDAEMSHYAEATHSSNSSAQTQMLGISGGGLILGVAFALFIIITLVRVLGRLSTFASAVAKGDFNYNPQISEKGEIGNMVTAMQQIPAIFQSVISQCTAAANNISSGLFNSRLDENSVSGGFRELVQTINVVSATYTRILDDLPVMLYTANMQRKVQYINNIGMQAAGSNAVGMTSFEMLGIQPTSSAGSIKAESGELTTSPGGKHMEVAYYLTPLYNTAGETAGFIEVINDITQIKDQQATMMQVAKEASDISDRVAAAAEELSAQVEQVSRGTEMQRGRVDSTASAMTEMNSTVLEVARSAGQASEQSDGTRSQAESGAELVNQVVRAINAVNTVATQLQKNMEDLGQQADSIGGVMNVISDIADQTNLLALNAAIEAARAGEAGRGFAVVADEVRKLAEKTMSATQEVGSNISAIQQAATNNIQAVNGAVSSVTEATELANTSGESLAQIVELATSTSTVVASIATAAEEQSATSDEITHAIEEINQVVAETAEGMIQASAAVQDLSRMAQELRRVMESLH
ncbi:methyl-accepting chemotaxis protein [Desulfovibrio sp. OttesenSCG-928-C06]|nr:methyl-accepting chemotaxis protein [Desulfovibrio sp. OttesenSCG-928-C06]